jgi:AmiR/NasT family two-component response regulator
LQEGQVSDIRVVVGKMPRLLGDIIMAALAAEKGLRLVGEASSEGELIDLCTREQPDVVVLGALDADAEAIGHRLLVRCPYAKVVALTSNGRATFLFELRPYKVQLGELSPKDLGRIVARIIHPVPGPVL